MLKTFVIAELGSTWNYSTDCTLNRRRGMRMIELAAVAGANAVKFQYCSNPTEMARRRKIDNPHAYDGLKWDTVWHDQFREWAKEQGLEYLCSVYTPSDVEVVATRVDRFKIASLEALDPLMWAAMKGRGQKQIICSTGGLTAQDCWQLGGMSAGMNRKFLHCTMAYPCPVRQVNIGAIQHSGHFLVFDGLSDHTGNVLTGAIAVAAGATIIEVHCRMDETPRTNADYPHSHSPERLKEYIGNIRTAEIMIGSGEKRVMDAEQALLKHQVRA